MNVNKKKLLISVGVISLLAAFVGMNIFLNGGLIWGIPLVLEVTDLLAVGVIHIGNYLKIRHKSIGWLFSAVAIVYFICRSLTSGFFSQSFGHSVSLIIAIFGFFNWRSSEKVESEHLKKTKEDGVPGSTPKDIPEYFYKNGILFGVESSDDSQKDEYIYKAVKRNKP